MTFLQAFEAAVSERKLIRRECWNSAATLKAYRSPSEEMLFADPSSANAICLIRYPEGSHWSGDYAPTLGDVKADDWEAFSGDPA